MELTNMEYITAAERAKYIRTELKANFPKVKFSVRSDNYSLGSCVYVTWTEGPTEEKVTNVIDCLVEDIKHLYNINIDTKYNGISFTRKISEELFEKVRAEVQADLKARDHPYQDELYRIRMMASDIIRVTNF